VVSGSRLFGAAGLAAAMACTPLGLWVYQDPAVTVARVRLQAEGATSPRVPVEVAIAVWNPNDYPLSATRVELRLQLDDEPVGRLARDSTMTVPRATTSTVALPLALDAGTSDARILSFGYGRHRFLIEGRATFVTPFGRRNVRFAQAGELAFGSPASSASAPADPDGSP